jgi:HD-GYP domain-containing protein (c-di-GMP phosphodiesterase class II)
MEIDQESVKSATALLGQLEPAGKDWPELPREANKKNRSMPYMTQILEQVIRTAQTVLSIDAASILLFRDNDQELFFEAGSGPVSNILKQVKLNSQYGIAGQVARTGKPLIVNDVSRSENFHKMMDTTTGFKTRSLICAPLIVNQRTIGVIEVLNKLDSSNFEEKDLDIVLSIAATTAVAIETTRLHQSILDTFKATITAITSAINAKDPSLRGHSQRVTDYTLLAATFFSLTPEETETLEYASMLHDIGKIAIDSRILNKPEPLTPPEWDLMRRHPAIGADLLKEIPFLEKASILVLSHHERHDGQGYPGGLKGEEIPLGARLIAVANAYDMMTIDRANRPAMSIEHSIKELTSGSGNQFCPEAVKALISGLHLNPHK